MTGSLYFRLAPQHASTGRQNVRTPVHLFRAKPSNGANPVEGRPCDLLPQDNFTESKLPFSSVVGSGRTELMASSSGYLTSSNAPSLSAHPSDAGISSPFVIGDGEKGHQKKSGFRAVTIARGWSAEADKILDYLECGIFDALAKQYLRSLIFAVYLLVFPKDEEDPNNIVEAYTFNFKYQAVPGSDTPVPIMSLGEDLLKLSLNGSKNSVDPVTEATKNGKLHTLGDVQKSLKALIKVLITFYSLISNGYFNELERRFAKFKVFYYPYTPASYEPPHFRPGDAEKDRWFFATHRPNEVPEKYSIGNLETVWHGVDVHVASVSGIIPAADDSKAPFAGMTTGPNARANVAESAASRRAHIEAQRHDARERRVVWDAETFGRMDSRDVDADWEVDPEYLPTANVAGLDMDIWEPLGVRNQDGEVVPLSKDELNNAQRWDDKDGDDMDVDRGGISQEFLIGGSSESVPSCLKNLIKNGDQPRDELAATQIAEPMPTQPAPTANVFQRTMSPMDSSPLPPSDFTLAGDSTGSIITNGIDTQFVMDAVRNRHRAAEEMLDMETQAVPSNFEIDAVESFRETGRSPEKAQCRKRMERSDEVIDCDCGVSDEDSSIQCDGGCEKWFHIWCMGYHSIEDERIGSTFKCFSCRIRSDDHFEMIFVQSWYQDLLSKYNNLALFRRAIKVAETHEPRTHAAFTKLIACEVALAGQIVKRLETEGFITKSSELTNRGQEDNNTVSGKGKGKAGKAKGKQPKQRKNLKEEYIFVKSSKQTQEYLDYFNPKMDVEMKLIGFDNLVRESKRKTRMQGVDVSNHARKSALRSSSTVVVPETQQRDSVSRVDEMESQTQEDSQAETYVVKPNGEGNKRKMAAKSDAWVRASKKLKISVVPGVDLCD
ncbi:hypothetical protein EW146_g3631 [Bondarzewia mesenterica]|uniref:HORMA domain-containing protein n=1 Tax=Bondarzewia mesenterica TaxID=1095465 RepID=A0A4S4M2U4_9AGAM|nr:hypothetical protein EW146_g3631 [Bondarzewia mesenterica]